MRLRTSQKNCVSCIFVILLLSSSLHKYVTAYQFWQQCKYFQYWQNYSTYSIKTKYQRTGVKILHERFFMSDRKELRTTLPDGNCCWSKVQHPCLEMSTLKFKKIRIQFENYEMQKKINFISDGVLIKICKYETKTHLKYNYFKITFILPKNILYIYICIFSYILYIYICIFSIQRKYTKYDL